jgi:membrane dipeptidase
MSKPRARWWVSLLGPALVTTATAAVIVARSVAAQGQPDAALARAKALLRRAPIFDGHNDLPWVVREDAIAHGDLDQYDLAKPTRGDTDLPRLRQGGVGAQFWSVYIPGDLPGGFAHTQLEQIELARRILVRYSRDLAPASTAAEVKRALAQHRIAGLLGMEGGHAIENSLGALRAYYQLGVRYMTLTHNQTLAWADAALDEPRHHGLTKFGVAVVREMNRLGMLVDLSHTSPETMRAALDATTAPVIFSHSCARGLVDHPRNVPDDVLARLPANGGVVLVTFVPSFANATVAAWELPLFVQQRAAKGDAERAAIEARYVAQHGPRPRAMLRDVADHIDYIKQRVGADHVGLGGDFYGATGDRVVVGLEDVSKYPDLLAELVRRGWSDADLAKLTSGNLLRVLGQAEQVARRLQRDPATASPSMATLESSDGPAAPAAKP